MTQPVPQLGLPLIDVLPERPDWDETFFAVAEVLARRATCPRFHTATVAVDADHQIISTGYNGSPRKMPHCTEVGCLMVDGHCKRTVHGEANAVLSAAKHGKSLLRATLYVLGFPCLDCAVLIIQAGVSRVLYAGDYPNGGQNDKTASMLRAAGIVLKRVGGRGGSWTGSSSSGSEC